MELKFQFLSESRLKIFHLIRERIRCTFFEVVEHLETLIPTSSEPYQLPESCLNVSYGSHVGIHIECVETNQWEIQNLRFLHGLCTWRRALLYFAVCSLRSTHFTLLCTANDRNTLCTAPMRIFLALTVYLCNCNGAAVVRESEKILLI